MIGDEALTKLASICTIISTIYGICTGNFVLTIIVLVIILLMIGYKFYRQRHSNLSIKYKKIDFISLVKPIIKSDHTLAPEYIEHKCVIKGEEACFVYTYEGICCANSGEDSIIFNIGAEEFIPFEDLECYAYDLYNDPKRKNSIRPELVGDDGLSKKVKVKFLKRLQRYNRFKIEFTFIYPHCIKYGKDYVLFFSSYKQNIQYLKNILYFIDDPPMFVELHKEKNNTLLYQKTILKDKNESSNIKHTYIDIHESCSGTQTFLYFFERQVQRER